MDHVYFVHPSTDSRPTYRSTYQSSIGRYVDRHIGRQSFDMSAEMCQSTYRPTHRSNIGQTSVDMSTNTRPICRSICRPRVIVRLSADMSIDTLPTFRRYFTATFRGCLAWNKVIHNYNFLSLPYNILRAMLATPRFSEDSLYKSGIVNHTNLTKDQLNSIEPNRPDCCSIGSVIAHNRAETFR